MTFYLVRLVGRGVLIGVLSTVAGMALWVVGIH